MTESITQLLARYVDEETYSFGGFKKLDVNTRGEEAETLLHMAVTRGAAGDVKLLLQNGAEVNAVTDVGVSPLHRAIYNGDEQIVVHLLEAGANPEMKDKWGNSAVSLAAKSANVNLLTVLQTHLARHKNC